MVLAEARRSSGSAETTAAMSSRERPAPVSSARIASAGGGPRELWRGVRLTV
jgi:hypothetical protein